MVCESVQPVLAWINIGQSAEHTAMRRGILEYHCADDSQLCVCVLPVL